GSTPKPTLGTTSPAGLGGPVSPKKIDACMVTDTGGIDDKSFNAAAWAGLQAAHQANPNITAVYTESTSQAYFEPNLIRYASGGCDLIVAVGGLMGAATDKVAASHPGRQFAIVDYKSSRPNVYSMQFNVAQASYLAGYLAAGTTKTGKVGTYGGLKIPPVTLFMDGFADGVAHYNQVHGTNVQVLGWDRTGQNGLFANNFADQALGRSLARQLASQGVDVILPVAGGTGLGTLAEAQSAGTFAVIWVDQDGCVSATQYCGVFASTVVKNISDAVKDAALAAADRSLIGGYIGTLANHGVGLAPYHDFEAKIPQALKDEVSALAQQIAGGQITVTSPAAPK
ncbi:MAG TPA: BMP family ABC transporter substrate-binding protein, partial [Micromonosporaceae bacterium]|nr:BMP family ABC transporter substrate-binding protein [Micromonosporaceae bacterium]